MFMKVKRNYSLVRGYITRAIRELEVLYYCNRFKQSFILHSSEYDYWITSLDLVRNCLYGCKNSYTGQIDIVYAIKEIRSELTNFVKVVQKVNHKELKHLDKAWLALIKAEKELK